METQQGCSWTGTHTHTHTQACKKKHMDYCFFCLGWGVWSPRVWEKSNCRCSNDQPGETNAGKGYPSQSGRHVFINFASNGNDKIQEEKKEKLDRNELVLDQCVIVHLFSIICLKMYILIRIRYSRLPAQTTVCMLPWATTNRFPNQFMWNF